MYDEGPYPIETKQIIGLVSIWWGPLSWKIFSIFKNFAKYFFDSIEKVFSNIKFSAKTTCVPSFNLIPSILSTTDQEQSELIGKKKNLCIASKLVIMEVSKENCQFSHI